MHTWTVTVLIFSLHYLLNPTLQKDRNLIQSLYYVKAKEKQGSPGLLMKVFCDNAKTAAFQFHKNSIFPFLQLEKIKSPVVCVILLHTESMILLEAKRLFPQISSHYANFHALFPLYSLILALREYSSTTKWSCIRGDYRFHLI